MTVNGRLTEVNEPSVCCCSGPCEHAQEHTMRAGSLAHVWQMSQQCSCSNVDSLGYHPAKSICLSSEIFFFFYISPPLVGCDQDWIWAEVEPR